MEFPGGLRLALRSLSSDSQDGTHTPSLSCRSSCGGGTREFELPSHYKIIFFLAQNFPCRLAQRAKKKLWVLWNSCILRCGGGPQRCRHSDGGFFSLRITILLIAKAPLSFDGFHVTVANTRLSIISRRSEEQLREESESHRLSHQTITRL